jgi:hypothetical protein
MRARGLWIVAIVVGVGVMFPQFAQSPLQDQLLEEVKGLRADVRKTSGVNLQAQVLVGRLQVQQDRVAEAQRRLYAVQGQLGVNAQLRQHTEGQINRTNPQFKDQLTQLEQEIERLKTQEAEARWELSTEQAAWTDLSTRLENLDSTIPK